MYTDLILYIICIYCSLDSMHQGLVILSGKKKKNVSWVVVKLIFFTNMNRSSKPRFLRAVA